MGTLYQVVKYNQSSLVNGTVVYGPTTCGTALSQICGSNGLFVDLTGSIYYSDSSNYRVLKITPFSSSASVVAGTSGMAGSALNQLNSPAGIYVDGNGALYVADQYN
jgi:sugar lactone lactonase YvrE